MSLRFDADDPDTWDGRPTGPHPDEEAPAGSRALAHLMRGHYVALRQENFTETQALTLLGVWLGTMSKGGS